MDTVEILSQSKRRRWVDFKGVFAIDRLPSNVKLPAGFVINLDKHNEPGSHWVSIFVNKLGQAFYFDSFGMKPTATVQEWIDKNHFKLSFYNKIKLQNEHFYNCGHFALAFLDFVFNKNDGKTFSEKYKAIKNRDIAVIKYIQSW